MENTKRSGIYAIKNKANGKVYVGSSQDYQYRLTKQHKPHLNKGTHFNRHLQNAWSKYGETNFEFEILESCHESCLTEREGHWIEALQSWNRKHGYNLARIVNGRRVMSEESRQRLSLSLRTYSQEIYDSISNLYKEGTSKNAIAIQLGIGRHIVYSCLEHDGLHRNECKGSVVKLTPELKEEIKALREEGMSWHEISDQSGVSRTQLYRAMGIRDGKYGDGSTIRKNYKTLTPEVREKAVALRDQGKSWKEIGDELGVCRQIFYWNGLAKEQKNMVRQDWSPDRIAQLADLREKKIPYAEIAKIMECTIASAQRAISRNKRQSI